VLAIGLMSGTSLDGVDAALVSITPKAQNYSIELLRFETYEFDADLQKALLDALPPNTGSQAAVANLHHALGNAYARAAKVIAGNERIGFVASHGQTVWHDGDAHVTLQLGDAFLIREALEVTVCYDFRSADCAAGGHGAPLVPYVDALLLSGAEDDRVALNLGGIANLTLMRKGAGPQEAVALDTGPGNMLLDAFVRQRTNGQNTFDRDGTLAAAGRVNEPLLKAMLSDEYFVKPPPKTTGRERFGAQFLAQHDAAFSQLSIEDGAATLAELTAATVAEAISPNGYDDAHVIVSGGGAHNRSLLARLQARLPRARVETSDSMGIPVDAKEAMAFAVLGYETLRGRTANVPAATGARHAVVLGAIAPKHLQDLLAQIEEECRL
jgi:anhydro-N-acetylmuramic acid kinase